MNRPHDTKILNSLLAREQRAPRYTSYPTAMEFHEGFGESEYRQALSRTNEEPVPAPLSLYLHIPFCASACYYCGCHRTISRNVDRHEDYLNSLMQEIALQGQAFAVDRKLSQIHFGGGTPNILRPRQLARLLNQILRYFPLADECEISLEVDPRQYRARDAHAWALLGFNRISLGIQDTDPRVQKLINRRQSNTTVQALVNDARRVGIASINFDLIYGLPGQNPERFGRTLDFVGQMKPDRIAIFHYAHMPQRFPAQRAIRDEDLPSLESAFEIHANARAFLLEKGYQHIGMDHYALPEDTLARAHRDGQLRRNFQGYTVLGDCDLIGMGVSAISQVGDCFAQNHSDAKRYQHLLQQGQLPIKRGLARSHEDCVRADIIERIMCQGRVDFDAVEKTWGLEFLRDFAESLAQLQRLDPLAQWARIDEHSLEITPAGQDLLRLIAQCFDAYSAKRANRQVVVPLKPMHHAIVNS